MNTTTVTMKLNEEKKHSVRYDAADKDADVRSIYIMKSAFAVGEQYPKTIKLTLEEA
jgi:hypothetical protein